MVNLVADRQLIGYALAQLSAEHRAVIRRSYYEARTTAQIADDLQIGEATVKSRLHYAMGALRHPGPLSGPRSCLPARIATQCDADVVVMAPLASIFRETPRDTVFS